MLSKRKKLLEKFKLAPKLTPDADDSVDIRNNKVYINNKIIDGFSYTDVSSAVFSNCEIKNSTLLASGTELVSCKIKNSTLLNLDNVNLEHYSVLTMFKCDIETSVINVNLQRDSIANSDFSKIDKCRIIASSINNLKCIYSSNYFERVSLDNAYSSIFKANRFLGLTMVGNIRNSIFENSIIDNLIFKNADAYGVVIDSNKPGEIDCINTRFCDLVPHIGDFTALVKIKVVDYRDLLPGAEFASALIHIPNDAFRASDNQYRFICNKFTVLDIYNCELTYEDIGDRGYEHKLNSAIIRMPQRDVPIKAGETIEWGEAEFDDNPFFSMKSFRFTITKK